MSLKRNRLIFLSVWLFVVLSGPLTILRTATSTVLQSPELIVYTFLRATGLIAYSLLLFQIVVGANLEWWLQKLGARAYRFHIFQGLFAYAFLLMHPLLNSAFIYLVTASLSNAVFSVLPSAENQRDLFMNLGRLALVLLTVAVGAARLRTSPFFRRNWLYFHYLNYVAFIFVFFHAQLLGSDVSSFPFNLVFYAGGALVFGIIVQKLLKRTNMGNLIRAEKVK
jgi:methionine sulfoxide reductase heme-binding subunit